MNDKEYKISQFKSKLKLAFVDRYDDINKAKDLTNNKLAETNIKYLYDYNTFCVDLLNEGIALANKIEDIEEIDLTSFLYILLNNMITNKINENNL